jgi:type VI secretion system secreted protein VgrG
MAKLVKATIYIDGAEVKQFYQFSLSQGIFAHHVFKLVCPAEALDGPKGILFSNSRNFIGSTFKIKIENAFDTGAQVLKFSGMVTQVESTRFSGHVGDIIISGFSPTILMDNGPHCNSWEKKAVKNIATDVFSHFAGNILSPQIQPVYGETLAYTVQYKETAWQFLNRLAATYGEWFFYNGENIVLGTPKPKTASLVYGSNLSNFSMALQLRPGNFEQVSYDYMNHQVYNATPQNIQQKAGLNELGKFVYQKSNDFFAASPKHFNNTFLTNKKQLEDITNIRAAAQSSNMVRFNGSSTHFGVQLGNTVKVSDNVGEYTVIEVTHHCDGQGNYSNDFIAIPSTIKVPPVTNYAEPHSETQSAIVTDNHDPKGLGRVRVKFHWMKAGKKTPWLRVTSPHGGGGKGMHFIPEVGEEVIVGFEGDSPVKPYIIGTVYHGKANSTYSNEGNDVKALQTRSGNRMIMNDKDGSVFMSDKGGANTMMDGAGNITTNANVRSTVNVGGTKDAPPTAFMTMDAEGNIVIDGKTTITLRVGGNTITISKEGIVASADDGDIKSLANTGSIMIDAKTTMKIHSTGAMTSSTDADLVISAGPSAKISSSDTDII